MKTKFLIVDWCYNVCFSGKTFDTFDDAESFLSETLASDYEADRCEYEILSDGSENDSVTFTE